MREVGIETGRGPAVNDRGARRPTILRGAQDRPTIVQCTVRFPPSIGAVAQWPEPAPES